MFGEAAVFAMAWVVVIMGGAMAHLVLMLAVQDIRERRLCRYAKTAGLKAEEAIRKAEYAQEVVLRAVGR